MPTANVSPTSASAAVADFWARIREDDLTAVAEVTRSRVLEACSSVDTFSFEIVEGEEGKAGDNQRESSATSVEAGTPRPVVEAWNQDKLMGLVKLVSKSYCGAAIGNDVLSTARDFKACALHWKDQSSVNQVLIRGREPSG